MAKGVLSGVVDGLGWASVTIKDNRQGIKRTSYYWGCLPDAAANFVPQKDKKMKNFLIEWLLFLGRHHYYLFCHSNYLTPAACL